MIFGIVKNIENLKGIEEYSYNFEKKNEEMKTPGDYVNFVRCCFLHLDHLIFPF